MSVAYAPNIDLVEEESGTLRLAVGTASFVKLEHHASSLFLSFRFPTVRSDENRY